MTVVYVHKPTVIFELPKSKGSTEREDHDTTLHVTTER